MRPIGIADSVEDSTYLLDRICSHFSSKESIAVVSRSFSGDDHGIEFTSYELSDNGYWSAAGTHIDFSNLLDKLAAKHEYVFISGFPELNIPYLVINGNSHSGTTLMDVSSISELNIPDLISKLDETEPFESLDSLIGKILQSPDANLAGAIATFTGRVRELDHLSDSSTTRLEFEKYSGIADSRMEKICSEIREKNGVFEVLMHHRTGPIESGNDVVFVVVLAGHRNEAFEAVQEGINRIKSEVPIFKKEIKIDGSFWVHDRP
jgi:molybdopterin synthase catalytic subunit